MRLKKKLFLYINDVKLILHLEYECLLSSRKYNKLIVLQNFYICRKRKATLFLFCLSNKDAKKMEKLLCD